MMISAARMVNKNIVENIPSFSFDFEEDLDEIVGDNCDYDSDLGYLEMF